MSLPPTLSHELRPQQYVHYGLLKTQRDRAFANGISFRQDLADPTTDCGPRQDAFTDQVAIVDNALHTVKAIPSLHEAGKSKAQDIIHHVPLNTYRSQALDERAARNSNGTLDLSFRFPKNDTAPDNFALMQPPPNKTAIYYNTYPINQDNHKDEIAKSIVTTSSEVAAPVVRWQPPTEPRADRERREFLNAQRWERQRIGRNQHPVPRNTGERFNGISRLDGALVVDMAPPWCGGQVFETEKEIANTLAIGRQSNSGQQNFPGENYAYNARIVSPATNFRQARFLEQTRTSHEGWAAERGLKLHGGPIFDETSATERSRGGRRSYQASREGETRHSQAERRHGYAQPNPRQRPGKSQRRCNVPRVDGSYVPGRFRTQNAPGPRSHQKYPPNRAKEENFAREISNFALVVDKTAEATEQSEINRIRREEITRNRFTARNVAEIEKGVELAQAQARATTEHWQGHLAQLPIYPTMMLPISGQIFPQNAPNFQVEQPLYLLPQPPGFPSYFPNGCPPDLPPDLPPGHPDSFGQLISHPPFYLPPGVPPPPPFPPTFPVFPQSMPPPGFVGEIPKGLAEQQLFAMSQQKLCNYIDIRAVQRRRTLQRIQGAGVLDEEKDLWAKTMSDLKNQSCHENSNVVLVDPRKGRRDLQMNGTHRSGPNPFLPPRFSTSPKPEIEHTERHPEDPLPSPVLMSGSPSVALTPTLNYRRLHGTHRLTAKNLREAARRLEVEQNKLPERDVNSQSLASPITTESKVGCSVAGPRSLSAGKGAARIYSAPVDIKRNGERNSVSLANKSFLGNTIFGELPGNVSRKQSPIQGTGGGRRGRRLFERAPRTPPNQIDQLRHLNNTEQIHQLHQMRQRKNQKRCGNLSPSWQWSGPSSS